jgi:hypothetical protein
MQIISFFLAPAVFGAVFKIIKPILDINTVQKIEIFGCE